jgi:cystathionine gamma-synthase/methionine-gamma-lyase
MAGAVVTSVENRAKLYELNKLVGSTLGPFEAWLALRGVKTLPLRLRQQFANAARLADWLAGQPRVARVFYPGLPSHPQHALARRLFGGRGYGGMLSFEIAGAGRAEVFRFMEALRLCLPATTLGDVYTLVLYPTMSSHRALSEAEREQVGIGTGWCDYRRIETPAT